MGTGAMLLNNTLYLDVLVLSRKDMAGNIINKGNEKIAVQIADKLLTPMNQLRELLKGLLEKGSSETKPPTFTDDVLLLNLFSESFSKVKESLESMPETLTVPETVFQQWGPMSLINYNTAIINPYKSATYFADILLREPLYRNIEQLERSVSSAIIECKEANSLLLFHLNNANESSAYAAQGKSAGNVFYKKLLMQVEAETLKVETNVEKIRHSARTYFMKHFLSFFTTPL
ncbi:MAG: hypothetical protein HC896_10805 [Bacteroidales bacterium]|nr:hypothetical protein [Bacteroidales bacterium]